MASSTPAPPPSPRNLPPSPKPNRQVTRILIAFTVGGALFFLAGVLLVVVLLTREETGTIDEGTFLAVRLKGEIHETPPPPDLFSDPNKPRLHATLYAQSIRKAAEDDRIEGLYLHLEGPRAGLGRLQEVRSAIVDFVATGKPCVAYAEVLDDSAYYLASACPTIVLAPSGITVVNGMAVQQTYYREVFDKLGIDPEFEHVGDFKSAVEPYELNGPSEAATEAMNYLLDGIWERFLADVAQGRGMEVEAVRALLDSPPLSPKEALERGLVDALAFPDAVRARIHQVEDEDWTALLAKPVPEELQRAAKERFTPITELAKAVRAENRSKDAYVAVVHAEGPIVSGKADGGLFADSILADQTFRSWMRELRKDEDIKAVVIRVNSPGGSGLASDMMWREIQLAKADGLPVVVSMVDYAASGGYFISAPADWIVAQPSTITGSIGVFGGKLNLSGAYEKLGLRLHTYKRGKLADLFSSTAPFSEEGRQTYRRFLQDFYDLFLDRVSEGRGLDRDAVHAVAQGRVWTGLQAKDRGLVDAIGGLDVATHKAAELAGLDDYGIKRWPQQKDPWEMLLDELTGTDEARLPPILEEARDRIGQLVLLEAMLADGPVALLPGDLRIR